MATIETPREFRDALQPRWTVEDSAALYQVHGWGRGYFGLNDKGHVVALPTESNQPQIDLYEVVLGLQERGLNAPVLLRLSDLLRRRLADLNGAFAQAITESEYRGVYQAVFPIKVNQERQVLEEVVRYGEPHGIGLEVGSKPELLAVMSLTVDRPETLIICNGFKDAPYIEAVILATKLGRRIIPVVEKYDELRLIVKYAQRYQVKPRIGVRVKLSSMGAGRWRSSSGATAKFGLFVSELLNLFDELNGLGLADCLQLIHCHIGSQVQDIRQIKQAVSELGHVYAELVRMGAGMGYIDIGGGLGVDYDGSQTNYPSSMNYTLREYASDVVSRIATVCNEAQIAHPTILTESGRAMIAHHSVLVFNVLGSSGLEGFRTVENLEAECAGEEEIPQPIWDLHHAYTDLTERRLLECYHDAIQARDEALQLFDLGYVSLRLRGLTDRLFWGVCTRVRDACRKMEAVPDELEGLERILGDTYFCNFSLFQSMPDSWAVGQLFPIVPLHRHDEKPLRKAVLADITCDSDGKINRFVDIHDVKKALDVHPLREGEPYYLAAFLVGAYQETLGDLHNLFGDTHIVHIRLDDRGGWRIGEVVRGDTAGAVLGYVHHETDRLYPRMSQDCEEAVRAGKMTLAESRALLNFFETALGGYTYIDTEES